MGITTSRGRYVGEGLSGPPLHVYLRISRASACGASRDADSQQPSYQGGPPLSFPRTPEVSLEPAKLLSDAPLGPSYREDVGSDAVEETNDHGDDDGTTGECEQSAFREPKVSTSRPLVGLVQQEQVAALCLRVRARFRRLRLPDSNAPAGFADPAP